MSRVSLKMLTTARNVLVTIAFIGSACSTVLWTHEFNTLPQAANTVTGNVYPRNIHGRIVYQTYSENRELQTVDIGCKLFFVVGFLVILMRKNQMKESADVRHVNQ